MGDIKICSLNCRGLGEFRKRRDVLNYLRQSDFNIFLLQDIHCSPRKENAFRNTWGSEIKVASFSHNARGVAILSKSVDLKYQRTQKDIAGNYIIARVRINDTIDVVLGSVYGPNSDDPNFFSGIESICSEMKGSEDIPVILGGDFNLALNHRVDTVNYRKENHPRAVKRVQCIMDDNNWIDIFREQNGEKRKFTWKLGAPPRKQARLDYFIVSEILQPMVFEADVIPGYRSDHSMITLGITLTPQRRGKGFYKMNASLLAESNYQDMIRQTIKESVATYALPVYTPKFVAENPEEISLTISWSLFWETLVLNMRTQTITYAIHRSKKRKEEEAGYIQNIKRLENIDDSLVTEEEYRELASWKEKLEDYRKIKMEGIIARSRVRWYEQGEKSTAYFLGLEKRNYMNKIITALRNSDSVMCTNQDEIMNSLVSHFTQMFDEQPIEQNSAEAYVDKINLKQLSDEQKKELDKPVTMEELGRALHIMHNNKAPGTDGFPTEFFKIFWKELSIFFYRMVVESYEKGELPMSMNEGILTLIPKRHKPRNEIKSYRPITLLNSSYKILATAMASRMKVALQSILGQEQTGFMPGRFIGDNSRLTYDLLQHLKRTKKFALFLSLDIQEAFNSVNWDFVRLILRKQNFPLSFIRWFDTFYSQAVSRIVYNGHISEPIKLRRSCRQGDPFSPYIFLIVMNVLLEQVKQNRTIKGIKIDNIEYKVSAYADDTLCYLDGSVNSCRSLFEDLGRFAKYSGLRPNIEKTQAFWAGDATGIEPICPDINMTWCSKLTVLGITFSNQDSDSVQENYESKLNSIKAIIFSWKKRYLTLAGKITVIKTLLIPILTHVLTVLPRPTGNFLKRVERTFFEFLWNSKVDRIKRGCLYKPSEDGGFSMIDIDIYITALKISWVKRDIIGCHAWCRLFDQEIAKGKFIWHRSALSLEALANSLNNKFWAEVLIAMAQYDNSLDVSLEDVAKHSIWFSKFTKFKVNEIRSWKRRGLVNINDLLGEDGNIASFDEIKRKFRIEGTMLDYQGLVESLPQEWKRRQGIRKEPDPVIHPNIQEVLKQKKGIRQLYRTLLHKSYSGLHNSWEGAWERELGQIDWKEIYKLNKCTSELTTYTAFQYKILTRIVVTNRLLQSMGIKSSFLCDRCNLSADTITHRFWTCQEVQIFWKSVEALLLDMRIQGISVLNKKTILLGCLKSLAVNHIIMLGKIMIAKRLPLSITFLLTMVKIDIQAEKAIASKRGKTTNYDNKWERVLEFFEERSDE